MQEGKLSRPLLENFSEEHKQILSSIRELEIKVRKKVNQIFAGEHHSAFKGQGMEFNEVRKYVSGDDARNIEWKVTARVNEPHVKVFQEERELVFNILLDVSASNLFGSGAKSKKEVALEIVATLAFASSKNRDKIGFYSFTDEVEHYLPPKKGRVHVFKIIKECFLVKPRNQKSNLMQALRFFERMQKKPSVLFIVSDFLFDGDYYELVKRLSVKHSMVFIHLQDDMEAELPRLGLLQLEDAEQGEVALINTHSKKVRNAFSEFADKRNEELKTKLVSKKTKYLNLRTSEDYFYKLADFFRREVIR